MYLLKRDYVWNETMDLEKVIFIAWMVMAYLGKASNKYMYIKYR